MSTQTCANHPNEITYVRCGRCDKPICVRCMVDTPVGKKCRQCAENRTHVTETNPRLALLAFLAATAVAVPAGWLLHQIPILFFLPAFAYGSLIAEVTLRAGKRRRSAVMQWAAGLAAGIGGVLGLALVTGGFGALLGNAYGLIAIAIGVAMAVSRVRSW